MPHGKEHVKQLKPLLLSWGPLLLKSFHYIFLLNARPKTYSCNVAASPRDEGQRWCDVVECKISINKTTHPFCQILVCFSLCVSLLRPRLNCFITELKRPYLPRNKKRVLECEVAEAVTSLRTLITDRLSHTHARTQAGRGGTKEQGRRETTASYTRAPRF